jgi:cobalt/nickel transport system ATP-binding protein
MSYCVIKNLNYTYPDGKTGLNNVSLSIEGGMKLALVGQNGSGKTTLLYHIVGFLDGDGYINVAGIERTGKTIAGIREKTGFLFSSVEYQFIMPDVFNDVMLSIKDEDLDMEQKREKALSWMDTFNISRYRDTSPLDLSSGEMKRAAMAAILAGSPELIILDEPLNNLDKTNSLALINILKSLPNTMIFATHRRLLAEDLATHIAVMNRGEITAIYEKEKGSPLRK